MTYYADMIRKLLRCTEDDARMIEHIMRDEVFHSTLDWQSKAEFNRGAREAARLLAADRPAYKEWDRKMRDAFARMTSKAEATERAPAHEI